MNPLTRLQKIGLALLILFAAVGLADSLIIHLKEIRSLTDSTAFDSCRINSLLDCGAVAKSQASRVAGIPVSLLGSLFYDAVAAMGVALAFSFPLRRWQAIAVSAVMAVALFFSYRLLYVSYFGIGALCPYCLVSNLSTTMVGLGWALYALPFLRVSRH